MNKSLRLKIYQKFNGKCAYCGKPIEFKAMQVDHYWPQFLAHLQPGLNKDRIENFMPSCRKCNLHKGGLRPEEWRKELGKQVQRLRKNAQFDRALRFGQVAISETPIIFFFERAIL